MAGIKKPYIHDSDEETCSGNSSWYCDGYGSGKSTGGKHVYFLPVMEAYGCGTASGYGAEDGYYERYGLSFCRHDGTGEG
jgi:hypothetical protein